MIASFPTFTVPSIGWVSFLFQFLIPVVSISSFRVHSTSCFPYVWIVKENYFEGSEVTKMRQQTVPNISCNDHEVTSNFKQQLWPILSPVGVKQTARCHEQLDPLYWVRDPVLPTPLDVTKRTTCCNFLITHATTTDYGASKQFYLVCSKPQAQQLHWPGC